jgi:hypothetical protein
VDRRGEIGRAADAPPGGLHGPRGDEPAGPELLERAVDRVQAALHARG